LKPPSPELPTKYFALKLLALEILEMGQVWIFSEITNFVLPFFFKYIYLVNNADGPHG